MKNLFFIAILFLGTIMVAQNSNLEKPNSVRLNEAFKIQESNCYLIEQLLIANSSSVTKGKITISLDCSLAK